VNQVRFFIDPHTGNPHLWKHNVTEDEALEVMANADGDRRSRNGTRVIVGQTDAGRYLRVFYFVDGESVVVMTAFDLPPKQLRAFKKLRKKKS